MYNAGRDINQKTSSSIESYRWFYRALDQSECSMTKVKELEALISLKSPSCAKVMAHLSPSPDIIPVCSTAFPIYSSFSADLYPLNHLLWTACMPFLGQQHRVAKKTETTWRQHLLLSFNALQWIRKKKTTKKKTLLSQRQQRASMESGFSFPEELTHLCRLVHLFSCLLNFYAYTWKVKKNAVGISNRDMNRCLLSWRRRLHCKTLNPWWLKDRRLH